MDRALHERWQEGLARRLADLAKVVQPQINVVEGIVGRDGTGFNRGTNYPLGLVVAGINMVAVDSVASYLMGFDPQELIYLRVAAEAGLGCNDLAPAARICRAGRRTGACGGYGALAGAPRLQGVHRYARGLAFIRPPHQDPAHDAAPCASCGRVYVAGAAPGHHGGAWWPHGHEGRAGSRP